MVFVCTPQSYLPAKKRFVKTTGFAMEQFDERVLTRQLPNELSEADLFAVARVHFTHLAEDYLGIVVDIVLAAERNFVSDMEKIATLAKDNAREAVREEPFLADIDTAIAVVLATVEPTAPAQKPQQNRSLHDACKEAEGLPMPRRGLETLSRDHLIRPRAEVPA